MKKPPQPEEGKKPRRRVKKVKGHGGHHGGAWKVAYADFVTAMMALFLVLWLVSQADTKLKQAIANYFRSPGVFDTMNGGILSNPKKVSTDPSNLTSKDEEQMLFSAAESLKKKFDSKPEFSNIKDQVKIELTEEGIRIEILDAAEKVSFPVGSSELSEQAKMILTEIAKEVCTLPNPLVIGGHTDSRVFPSDKGYTNWELSADRANAARRYLQTQCVSPEQIKRIIGYGASQPLLPEDPYAPANRRISITVARMSSGVAVQTQEEEGEKREENAENTTPKVVEVPQQKAVRQEKEKAAQTASPKPKENSNTNSEPAKKPDIAKEMETKETKETKEATVKLLKDGSVRIGEPDPVPSKPKE